MTTENQPDSHAGTSTPEATATADQHAGHKPRREGPADQPPPDVMGGPDQPSTDNDVMGGPNQPPDGDDVMAPHGEADQRRR